MGCSQSNEEQIRLEIIEIGRRLWLRGLVAAHDGNISVRLDDKRLLCTIAGVSKGFMAVDDIILVDMNGNALGGGGKPSSERMMHIEIYKMRPDVRAIVHAHPPHGTAYAVKGVGLPSGVMPEIDVLLGQTPVVPFLPPGSAEFAEAVGKASHHANVLFLARHGVTAIGRTLEEAWFRMESLDHCCKILMLTEQLPTG